MRSTAAFTSWKRAVYAALGTGLAFTMLACSSAPPAAPQPTAAGQAAQPAGGGQFTFAVITHSDGTDNFWPVVKNGAEAAGKALGVKINYTFAGDPLKQSQLIDNAVSQKVDGIAVSLPNADALKGSIQKAEEAGIPVITINSGEKEFKNVGALTHVGQDEAVAGRGAGERLKAAGLTNILCLIHEAGNVGLAERCQGTAETFGGKVTQLQVNLANLPDVTATVKAKLQADPSIDGVLALNPGVATAALAATKEAGNGKVKLATFDLSKDIVKSIEAGDVLFAVDQQQYLQGYLPVMMLYLYKTNLNTVGGGQPVLTGPGFVTSDNAKQVEDLAAKGSR